MYRYIVAKRSSTNIYESSADGIDRGNSDVAGGDAGAEGVEECHRGLKMRTTIRPKIIRSNRKMHFRRPVFF
jgi:hypothetical protein